MSDPFEQDDELKKQYLDKALHANDSALQGIKFSDLLNKDSTIYKSNAEEKAPQSPLPEKPKFDADGFPIIEQVHTYREDLSGIVNEDKLSLSRIAMMQGEARRSTQTETVPKSKNLESRIFTIVGSILIIISIGIIGGIIMLASQKKAEETKVAATPKERYLLFAEKKENFDITKSTKTELASRLSNLKKDFREEDSVLEIVPTQTSDSGIVRSPLSSLLDAANFRIPDDLRRSLADRFFFGLYSNKGRTDPFLIVYTSSYDTAYPALLSWENFMQDDFDWMYDTKPKTAGTTTLLSFKDRIVANKDARSFEDTLSRTSFFYAFLDDHTILFANTSDCIRKVMDRIREAKFQ